ncbi:MAG: murein biosynthesis integral membrane protein MurJ [Fusobacteriaceae bacterium]|nr:murein biosynthesis integral membrane protein MurJ [Fusobacteriaceae bacterium]
MFKNGIGMMFIIMISRLLGFVRAFAIAYYFGATNITDAYYSAFKISNFFRQLLGEGALGNAFIPIYNDKVKECGESGAKELIFSTLNIVFIFSTIISILTIIFSEEIINYTVHGFNQETKMLATMLLQIMAIYFIFISLSGMMGAVLNNFKKFMIFASTGIFFNLAIIFSAYVAAKTHGIKALGYGVVLAGFLQFIVLVPSFLKIVKSYSFKINWEDPYLKKMGVMILPMLVGIFAMQVNTIVDQYFASYLEGGGVSALENATRIYNLPIGVFGITISTLIFPILSKAISNNDFKTVSSNMLKGLNMLTFLVVPSMVIFTVYSEDIIRLTLSYGKFDENNVIVTSRCLFYYSIGLYCYTAIHLITRGFYGMKDSKTPVKFSIMAIIINICLNKLLIGIISYRGLALATSIASIANFSCLIYVFNKKHCAINFKKLISFSKATLVAVVVSTILSYPVDNIILRLIVFSLIYLLMWCYPFHRRGMGIFS